MSDFHTRPRRCYARKTKKCIWCGESILTGHEQVVQSGKFDGRLYRSCYHPECFDAAKGSKYALTDGFDIYEQKRGQTWEEL